MGHEERFLPRRLNARCRFTQGTFANTHGNAKDAPIPAVRKTAIEPPEFDPKQSLVPLSGFSR